MTEETLTSVGVFFYVRGTYLLKQTASGAQSVTSTSKIEGYREFEADLSALFLVVGIFVQSFAIK